MIDNQQQEFGDESDERGRADERGDGRDNKFSVLILYNGLERPLEVNPNQSVHAVLAHALALYGVQGDQTLALFLSGATQLNPNSSVQDAGVLPGSRLLLRPTQMQSGVPCG